MTDSFLSAKDIADIEEKAGYRFRDKHLLISAFVHASFVNENREEPLMSNERLEFLGDAVFGLIMAEYLYRHFPDCSEGELTSFRARLVEAPSCRRYIESLDIDRYILMGKGEKQRFLLHENTSIRADFFEAFTGAIYLDGGMEAVKTFLFRRFGEVFREVISDPQKNWIAELQDYAQKKYQKIPVYKVAEEEGPDHQKTFTVSVFVGEEKRGSGVGSSKKNARQAAAERAMAFLRENAEEILHS